MSLQRRFVYLVVNGGNGGYSRRAVVDGNTPATYHMQRINMSRFFYPEPSAPATVAANAFPHPLVGALGRQHAVHASRPRLLG
ncbi:hypothetical protein E2562_015386 [Oryza meyeriana var. granulata]|uniref:Uncharacterized protein n=1 Tax=Oryza meyeriana var. granulata TaxID=110450 RepID=A0A6G1EKH1_9ORYZ|nr:hypothetical protein E2562_015386 [Oryza meyeriana var. granulata]